MKNAEAYSGRQAKLESPARNSTAECREVARKNARLKQRMLKVRMRCAQSVKKPVGRVAAVSEACLVFVGKKNRSTGRTMPWMAPKITKVQFAPCHRPARTMVTKRFLAVFHSPKRLPPKGV